MNRDWLVMQIEEVTEAVREGPLAEEWPCEDRTPTLSSVQGMAVASGIPERRHDHADAI